jgi:EpsI family protein
VTPPLLPLRPWLPAIVLVAGVVASVSLRANRGLPLRAPLASVISDTVGGYVGTPLPITPAELAVARPDAFLLRAYRTPGDTASGHLFTLYIGYYDHQTQGKTIHSPKNCLPGAGWEPLASRTELLTTPSGPASVNRYLLQNHKERALVLYWYQGRGRVASNEYLVKWQLLRDAALRRRSDEALVRIIVPVAGGAEDAADSLAAGQARRVIEELYKALPS